MKIDHFESEQLENPGLKRMFSMTLTKASVQTLHVVIKWVAEHIKLSEEKVVSEKVVPSWSGDEQGQIMTLVTHYWLTSPPAVDFW